MEFHITAALGSMVSCPSPTSNMIFMERRPLLPPTPAISYVGLHLRKGPKWEQRNS